MTAVDRWREFEAWLRTAGLAWTVHYAPVPVDVGRAGVAKMTVRRAGRD